MLGPRWRLVVLEDSGELLAADARALAGQALTRLLNLSDGLLGEGLGVIVLLHERLTDLPERHAARARGRVVRDGPGTAFPRWCDNIVGARWR